MPTAEGDTCLWSPTTNIFLPRSNAGSALGRSSSGATRPPAAGPSTPEHATRRRALGDTVLVVDDNATVRMFMKAKLAPFGFEVDYAETGEEAVGLTGSREYACVFLDVVLPGIDGYQVCKLIKSNKQAIKKTAVVMLTSRSSPFDKLRGSLAGCDETVGATKAKQLKVLATSDPIPNDVIAVRPDTSPATIELVRKALLGLGSTPEGRKRLEDLFHADAFVTADDTDFAPLRESRAGR